MLQNERAEYGQEIVSALSRQLTEEYGRGFGRRNLEQMIRFAGVFPDEQIAQTLSAQLSWSHFVELTPIEDRLKREFYLTELPPKELLERKLHESIRLARERLARLEDAQSERKEDE